MCTWVMCTHIWLSSSFAITRSYRRWKMYLELWQGLIAAAFLTGILVGLPVSIKKNREARRCLLPIFLNLPLLIGAVMRCGYFIHTGQYILAIPDGLATIFATIIEFQRMGFFLKKG